MAIYDFPGGAATDHTGIIEKVTLGGVVAIEGNTSQTGSQSDGGMVCRKTRPVKWIVGAVRPEFEKEDGMDISKLTDAEILALGEAHSGGPGQAARQPRPGGGVSGGEKKGITDGTGPCAFATRAQAAVMTLRASKK